jgi:hypothetical protein
LTFNSVGPVTIIETGAIDLSGASSSGSTATLVAGTSISDAAGGVVTAGLLDTTSANGTTLNTQTHVVVAFRATNTMSGDILLMNAAAGGTLDLQGVNQAGGGAVAITEANTIDLSGDILADGSMVTLTALVLDMGNRTVDTNNGSDGDVTFVTDLLLNPGTVDAGTATFQIRPMTVTHVIEFAATDSAMVAADAFYDSDFTNIIAGSFIVGGDMQEGDIHVGNDLAALIFNPSATFRNSGTGTIFLESDYDSSVGDGNLTLDSGAGVTLRDLAANTSISVNLGGGALSVVGDATVADDADAVASGGITFADRVDSQSGEANPLTLTAGSGDILFGGAVGSGMNQQLGAVSITSANDVMAMSTIEAASLVQTAGTGTTTLSDDVTTTAAAGIDLTTAAILLDGLNIATGGGVVEMNAPTTLGGGTAITSAGGTVTFTDMLDSAAGETNTLDLMAGSGDILFMGAVGSGANQELGAMTIMDAMNVTAMSTIEAASLVQTAGTGTTTLMDDVTTVDQVNLGTNFIVLHGTPADELQIMATDAAGQVILDGQSLPSLQDVVITTSDGGMTSGGRISEEILESTGGRFTALDNSVNIGDPILGGSGIGEIDITVLDAQGLSFQITINWREGQPPSPTVVTPPDTSAQLVLDNINGTSPTPPPIDAKVFKHLFTTMPEIPGLMPGDPIPVLVNISSFGIVNVDGMDQGSIQLKINGLDILVGPGIQTTISVEVFIVSAVAGALPQSTLLPAPFSPPVVMQTAFEFPSQQVVESAPVEAQSSQGAATDVETRYYELRVVTFEVDGSLVERVEDTIDLSEPSSDDTADEDTSAIFPFNPGKLRELFRRLPDDHYRLYLIDEGGPRMILDFTIQQGRPVEVSDEPAAEEAAANSDETSQVDRPGGSSFWTDRIDANHETDRVAAPAGSWDHGEGAILGQPTDDQADSDLPPATFAERVGRASFVSCGSALLLATTFSDGRRRRRERSADRLMAEFSSWRRSGRIAPMAAGPTPSANRADLVTS